MSYHQEEKATRIIKVTDDTHKKLKLAAAQRELTMGELIAEMLRSLNDAK